MAYVLGYLYADGSLDDSPYMRGKYIQLTSVDRDSIVRVKKWLESEHKITTARSPFSGGKTIFVLRIGSHKIYDDLFKLGLYPNKSLTVKFPKIPKKYLGHFIRGYFDGDGCIFFERRMGAHHKLIIKRIRTIFTSGSRIFLEQMDKILKDIEINDGKIYISKRSYQSMYGVKGSIKIFKLMYKNTNTNSFFMRKFKIFKEYFELRPVRIDATIKKILYFHSKGLVAK